MLRRNVNTAAGGGGGGGGYGGGGGVLDDALTGGVAVPHHHHHSTTAAAHATATTPQQGLRSLITVASPSHRPLLGGAASGVGGGGGGGALRPATPPTEGGGGGGSGSAVVRGEDRVSTRTLLVIAVVITILTYVPYPPPPQRLSASETVASIEEQVGQQAGHMAQQAYQAEQDFEGWWNKDGRNQPPIREEDHPGAAKSASGGGGSINEATARMLQHESKWVDGEKKLKARLKVLAEKQQRGEYLGVPVLTRWLGEDFPAWVGEKKGWDERTWRKNVEVEYEKMRKEEEAWEKMVLAVLEQEKDRG